MSSAIGIPERLRLRSGKPHKAVRTPTVLQMEALECGPACLAIVLAHHRHWIPVEKLRLACGVSRDGASASRILRAARLYGLEGQGFKVEPEALRRMQPPLVLHWNFNHFVVFDGFLRRGRARINDPRSGPRTITVDELDQSMTGVVLALAPGPEFRPGGSPPRLLRALRQRLSGARAAVAFVLLASLALVIPGLFVPAFSRAFIDRVLLGAEAGWLGPLLGVMAATAAVIAILTWLQQSYLLRLETRLAITGSCRFLWHLLRLPLEFFQQRYTGDLSYRVAINDRVARLLSRDLAASALGVVLIVFYGTVMIQYDVTLTLVSLAVVSVNVAVLWWVSRYRRDGNRRLQVEQGKLTGTGILGLEMIESLKATGSESDLFARWAGYQAKVLNVRQELQRFTLALDTVPPLLSSVNAALILGLAGLAVIEGYASLGSLIAFQLLVAAFVAPVHRLVSLGGQLQTVEGELLRLDDVLSHEPAVELGGSSPEVRELGEAAKLEGHLELRRVCFGYDRLAPPLIQDLDLRLHPGQRVAIVGRTGSGKSTVARLVAGLYQPWSGEVLFDGRRRDQVPRSVLDHSLAIVDQDIFVFAGSVRDNLTVWDETVPWRSLIAASQDACIHDEILARSGGYDSIVEEGAANWSGGQLQRLEIARALAGDPSILVLDEATSALDADTERRIDHNLRRRRCTCLIIAHRLSTVRDADEILVLEAGRVVERGTHEELVEHGGSYLDLITDE